MQNVSVQGVLKMTSPLFIASPEDARVNPKTKRITYGGAEDRSTVAATAVQKMRLKQDADLLLTAQSEEDSDEKTGFIQNYVPIIPANSLRGRLRRQAANIIFEHLRDKGETLTLDAYHVLTCGAPHGHPEKDPAIADIQAFLDHPYFGLFGGGPKMIRGGLRMNTGWPILKETIDAKIIPKDFEKRQSAGGYNTDVLFIRRVDDALEFANPLTGEIVDNYLEAIERFRELASSEAEIVPMEDETPAEEQKAAQKDKGARGVRSWSAFEVVVPGINFHVGFDIKAPEQAHVGLALLAWERLLNEQQLGGKVSLGFGRALPIDMVLVVDGAKHELFKTDSTTGQVKLNVEDEGINQFVVSFKEALADMNAAEIEKLSKPDKSLEDIKKEKEEKAAKNKAKKKGDV